MNGTLEDYSPQTPDAVLQNRRTTARFPLTEDVTYQYRQGKDLGGGSGKCVNIGSGGVLITTTGRLPVGRMVEVSINWPAKLDGACLLRFIASGPVVRSEEDHAAIRIDRYEFRTRGTRPALVEALSRMRGQSAPAVWNERRR